MTADWEMYFAVAETRTDLVSLELDLTDLPNQTLVEINVAARLLGLALGEFVTVVAHEAMAANPTGGYGDSHDSITGVGERPCFVCSKPTVYVDINFEAHICGGICEWAAWEAYLLALRGRNPWLLPETREGNNSEQPDSSDGGLAA